jgi:hypothetical protein
MWPGSRNRQLEPAALPDFRFAKQVALGLFSLFFAAK